MSNSTCHKQVAGAWWTYIKSDPLEKAAEFTPCTVTGKHLITNIPTCRIKPLEKSKMPNEEVPLCFAGPILDDQNQEIEDYIYNSGVPIIIRVC